MGFNTKYNPPPSTRRQRQKQGGGGSSSQTPSPTPTSKRTVRAGEVVGGVTLTQSQADSINQSGGLTSSTQVSQSQSSGSSSGRGSQTLTPGAQAKFAEFGVSLSRTPTSKQLSQAAVQIGGSAPDISGLRGETQQVYLERTRESRQADAQRLADQQIASQRTGIPKSKPGDIMGIAGARAVRVTDSPTYTKLDKAAFGFLPGGQTPSETTKGILETPGFNPQKSLIYSFPTLLYTAKRDKISDLFSSTAQKVLPKSSSELDSSNWWETSPAKFLADKAGIGKTKIVTKIDELGKGTYDILREKPLEIIETGAQIYLTGKALATVGGAASSTGGTILTKAGITSKGAKFAAVDLPIYYAESKALGSITEGFATSRGFTESQAKNIAFGSRLLQAEAFANIEGGKSLLYKPVTTKTGAFVSKITGGITEGALSTDAFFDRTGPIDVLGVTVGDKKLLPSSKQVTTKGFNTLTDPGYKTITKDVTRAEYNKIIGESEGKKYNLEGFKNVKYVIKDDGFTETATFSLKSDPVTSTKYSTGRLAPVAAGAGFGVLTAGSFGVIEQVFKGTKTGRVATTAAGYGLDIYEAPGDFLTPVFTPIGGTKIAALGNVKTVTASLGFAFDSGVTKTISKTVGATKSNPFAQTFQATKGSSDISKSNQLIKIDSKTQKITPSISNIPAINKVTGSSKSVTSVFSPVKTTTFDVTKVIDPVKTTTAVDVFNTGKASSVSSVSQLNNVFQYSTVFTPNIIIPPILPGGGGGGGVFFGKKRKKKRTTKYLPSLFTKKGKAPAFLTGLSIRPILK